MKLVETREYVLSFRPVETAQVYIAIEHIEKSGLSHVPAAFAVLKKALSEQVTGVDVAAAERQERA